VYTRLTNQYQQLAPRSDPGHRAAMIAFAKSQPEVADAGWTDEQHGDNFYVEFKDGTPFALLDNLVPSTTRSAYRPTGNVTREIVPKSKRALVLYSLGNAFIDITPDLKTILTKAGYEVSSGKGDLSSLVTDVADTGYFYWATHSGYVAVNGKQFPIITTATEFSDATDATAFIQGLKKDKLVGVVGATSDRNPNPTDMNGNGKIDPEEALPVKLYYAVRPAFVEKYFKFSKQSIVCQDSCSSAVADFSGAFTKAGASHYLGWDKVTTSTDEVLVFTDKLLGADSVAMTDPPSRPFDARSVLAWMQKFALDTASNGAKLVAVRDDDTETGILAPSIESLEMDEEHEQLIIYGNFGDDRANTTVTVNGAQREVVDWQPRSRLIKVSMPVSGPGSAGEVKVKVRGIESNGRVLTEWRGALIHVHKDVASLEEDITLRFHLRGDVASIRSNVGLPAVKPADQITMIAAKDSVAECSASGSDSVSGLGCTAFASWKESITVPHMYPEPEADLKVYTLTAIYDATKNALLLRVTLKGDIQQRFTLNCPGATPVDGTVDVSGGYFINQFVDPSGGIKLDLDSNLGIRAGDLSKTVGSVAPTHAAFGTDPRMGSARLTWAPTPASFPPTADMKRSPARRAQ
jgi:hypothetical protein